MPKARNLLMNKCIILLSMRDRQVRHFVCKKKNISKLLNYFFSKRLILLKNNFYDMNVQ